MQITISTTIICLNRFELDTAYNLVYNPRIMAAKAELSLRFLPVEALMELGKSDPRRKEVERLARLAATPQAPIREKTSKEHPRLHPSLEGKVQVEQLTIGGKSREKLLHELSKRGINVGSYARSMIESRDFTTLPDAQQKELVIGRVEDVVPNPKGSYATTKEIWAKRDEMGLESVPAEAALHYLLQNGDNLKLGDALWMSMETITDRHGDPYVFGVERRDGGLWLYSRGARPSSRWYPEYRFAFSLPQVTEA